MQFVITKSASLLRPNMIFKREIKIHIHVFIYVRVHKFWRTLYFLSICISHIYWHGDLLTQKLGTNFKHRKFPRLCTSTVHIRCVYRVISTSKYIYLGVNITVCHARRALHSHRLLLRSCHCLGHSRAYPTRRTEETITLDVVELVPLLGTKIEVLYSHAGRLWRRSHASPGASWFPAESTAPSVQMFVHFEVKRVLYEHDQIYIFCLSRVVRSPRMILHIWLWYSTQSHSSEYFTHVTCQ